MTTVRAFQEPSAPSLLHPGSSRPGSRPRSCGRSSSRFLPRSRSGASAATAASPIPSSSSSSSRAAAPSASTILRRFFTWPTSPVSPPNVHRGGRRQPGTGRPILRSMSWRQYGNALRLRERFREAEAAFDRAQRLFAEGTGDPPACGLSCFAQTVSCACSRAASTEAIQLDRGGGMDLPRDRRVGSFASVLVQRAVACIYADRSRGGGAHAPPGDPADRSEGDPHLLLAACHDLVRCYIELGPSRSRRCRSTSMPGSCTRSSTTRWSFCAPAGRKASCCATSAICRLRGVP